ncbi:MAG: hypothetical protein CTY16_13700 [Methylobacter sp.]|nr:MAG: hypothetical protein CTY16_13700 [Methylobacter sp.]
MTHLKKTLLLATAISTALATIPLTAHATNGYFAHGYGVRSKAMAGTGTAFSQDAIAAAINPAGLAYVGDRLDLELELFSPHREYRVQGAPTLAPGAFPLNPGTVESDNDFFPVPTVGWSHKLDGQQTVGVALYGNGGMDTDYPGFTNPLCPPGSSGKGTFCAGRTGIDMMQAFITATYARSFNEGRFALGISPVFAMQTFEAHGLGSFAGFSSNPSRLTNNDTDFSFGAGFRVGGQAELLPGVRLGASYKSRIYMSEFDNYAGLFADQGGFDIPDSFNVGLSWNVSPRFITAFDVEHIRYSDIKSVGRPLLPLFQGAALGTATGPGFGWNDMTIYKFGAQWQQNGNWTWRGGFSYGQQPIESTEVLFNILAPGVQEWHLTGGFSHALSKQDELSFAVMYSPEKTVSGPNPLSPGQTIDLAMTQFSLQFAWSRRF